MANSAGPEDHANPEALTRVCLTCLIAQALIRRRLMQRLIWVYAIGESCLFAYVPTIAYIEF